MEYGRNGNLINFSEKLQKFQINPNLFKLDNLELKYENYISENLKKNSIHKKFIYLYRKLF